MPTMWDFADEDRVVLRKLQNSPEFRDVEYGEDEDGELLSEDWDDADEDGEFDEDEGYLSDEDWEDALTH